MTSYPLQEMLIWKFLKMTWTTHVSGETPGPQWAIPPEKFIKLHPRLTNLTLTMIQMLQTGPQITVKSITETTNVHTKMIWVRRGIRPELVGIQPADQQGLKWTMLEQTETPQQNNFTNTTETRLACGIYTVLSALYAVRNWKIDFLQQIHISQARNWMAAIGLAINKTVSLHRCNCGRQYEQWFDQPTPPCPDCEKTRSSKTSNKKRARNDGEKSGKRAKLEEKTEDRQIAPLQDTSPHSLLKPIPDPNNYTPETAPATPPPALTSRPETETRRDPTPQEQTEPQPYQETEEKMATNSPPQSSR